MRKYKYYKIPRDMRIIDPKTRRIVELIEDEVLTEHMVKRYALEREKLEEIICPASDTYYMFGVRFALDKNDKSVWRW